MKILVTGATGATGRLLVKELLNRGHSVKVIVRSPETLPESVRNHEAISVISASILELSNAEMEEHVKECDALASCLGHNMSFKGVYGHPRKLVTDATRRLCEAVKANRPLKPTKFILMNTAGNSNRDIHEPISFAQKCVIGLVRLMLPPHVDNEQAADYLRTAIGQSDQHIEWAVVRPDTLLDIDHVTDYEAHPSPTRSAIFNAGKTSRINVGHFMADLITDDNQWNEWKGKMPVIYNREPQGN